jgi:protocatechuate 3,4-dioxygenase, beta subunit
LKIADELATTERPSEHERLPEVTGPALGEGRVGPNDRDLTAQHGGEPIGQRIQIAGRLLDSGGRPIPNALVEIWQANAAGRYRHANDNWPAPLDPNTND